MVNFFLKNLHWNNKAKKINKKRLTADELKFLADTNDLLNSCIDKNFI